MNSYLSNKLRNLADKIDSNTATEDEISLCNFIFTDSYKNYNIPPTTSNEITDKEVLTYLTIGWFLCSLLNKVN